MISFQSSSLLTARRRLKLSGLLLGLLLLPFGCVSSSLPSSDDHGQIVISVVGTNDVHGQLVPQRGRGGLAVFSGYVNALRHARLADDGGVLLIDAGDMWQGTLESNLSEGAIMVDAYNQLGYAAAAVGNHEFDFGPVGDRSTPANAEDDARGALRARATEADFPLLAANLLDVNTGRPVDWPNVKPSTMVDIAGIKVGVVGVMTLGALDATIAANVNGLRVALLADSITREAIQLREQGAALVIVTAHAGGSCTQFDDPYDLSSCEMDEEIMKVARDLPNGLVDHIIAGHQHRGIAHVVNGIAITASFSSTRSFGRVDFVIDRHSGHIRDRRIFAPQRPCPYSNVRTGECAWDDTGSEPIEKATYEGRTVIPDPVVSAIVARARQEAQALKDLKLGVYLETPITLEGKPESALGNLMTDALLEKSPADISLHNISGGIRAILTEGELTFGKVYQMFPFDNRVVILNLTGEQIRRVIEQQAHKKERRAGFSGMRVYVQCDDLDMSVRIVLSDGRELHDSDTIRLAVNDFIALGGDNILTSTIPEGGFDYPSDTPLARDILIDWLKERGGTLRADQFLGDDQIRWHMPDTIAAECAL